MEGEDMMVATFGAVGRDALGDARMLFMFTAIPCPEESPSLDELGWSEAAFRFRSDPRNRASSSSCFRGLIMYLSMMDAS